MLYETGWGNHVSSKGKNKHNYTPHKLDKEENERKGKERKGKERKGKERKGTRHEAPGWTTGSKTRVLEHT